MNDIIQDLEVNATNGKENFCYISEKQLKAMKELSKREAKENKKQSDKIKEVLTLLESFNADQVCTHTTRLSNEIEKILKEV